MSKQLAIPTGKRIRNNSHVFDVQKERIKYGPSLTVPDQTMSLKEILARSTNNMPLEGEREPLYYDEVSVPDIRRLDYVERQELIDELEQKYQDMQKDLENLRERQNEENEKRKDAEYEAKFLAKYGDQLKALNDGKTKTN